MTFSNAVCAATIAMHWDHILSPSHPNTGKTTENSWTGTAKKVAGLIIFAISCGLIGFKPSLLLFGIGGTYHFYQAYQKTLSSNYETQNQKTGSASDENTGKSESALMNDFGDKVPSHLRQKIIQEVSTLLETWSHYFPHPSKELISFLIEEYTKKEVLQEASLTAHSKASIGDVIQIKDGVYTAQGTTPKGEKIYFGIERLDRRSIYWNFYQRACVRLCDTSRGLLNYLGLILNDASELAKVQKNKESYELDCHEFSAFIQQMKEREIYEGGSRWKSLRATETGARSFELMLLEGNFVAYVSKVPIEGVASFPKSLKFNPTTLKRISQIFGNILMTVGVRNIDGVPIFENRGIFRNPLSLVEGGYSDISMQLHAFIGKAFKTHINSTLGINTKNYMTVFPLKQMEAIFISTVGRSRISIDHDLPPELYLDEPLKRASGEKQLLIPLDNLASLYREL